MKRSIMFIALLFLSLRAAVAAPPKDTCISCHAALGGDLAKPASQFEADIHHQAGLSCADCHGGDAKDETMGAMSRARGFRGAPKKNQIPDFCARCHSDAAYMHRFNPKMRVDQLSQYLTSMHGKRIKQGDVKVAACVDCHSVHNILSVSDTRSPVYPPNVASTCAHCHSDPIYMKGYGIPTNQAASYQKSVHAEMLAQGDMSSPTCSTCHGNHGAAPPGISSVASVCGTCHVFFAQLFEKSPHQAAFAKMGLPGCVQCHSNHEIVRPTDAWVGSASQSVCITCHAPGDKGYQASQAMSADLAKLDASIARAEGVLNVAERAGMEVSGPKVDLADANEALVKARVNVHTFDDAAVRKLTDAGVEIAAKSYQAGVAALRERDYRRKGLGLALIAIVLAISGLYMKIHQMESGDSSQAPR
ncbi:MAG TPA: cytochrome c3 family protein [Terriglobia bacterium]|nr:cytochrome c3 family protein [Terriglobia bacterium]